MLSQRDAHISDSHTYIYTRDTIRVEALTDSDETNDNYATDDQESASSRMRHAGRKRARDDDGAFINK